MYILKGNVHAEAGKILVSDNKIGFFFKNSSDDFTERLIETDSLVVENGFVKFDVFSWDIHNLRSYDDLKKYFVGKKYSNDDQIAIILNKDDSEEDSIAYEKMQEWRAWASYMARKIVELINE